MTKSSEAQRPSMQMRMDTEWQADVYLKQDTPPGVIRMLQLMASRDGAVDQEMVALAKSFKDKFFTLPGWRCCLRTDSAHYPLRSFLSITQLPDGRTLLNATWPASITQLPDGQTLLDATWPDKMYSGEIEAFWKWITPWMIPLEHRFVTHFTNISNSCDNTQYVKDDG